MSRSCDDDDDDDDNDDDNDNDTPSVDVCNGWDNKYLRFRVRGWGGIILYSARIYCILHDNANDDQMELFVCSLFVLSHF